MKLTTLGKYEYLGVIENRFRLGYFLLQDNLLGRNFTLEEADELTGNRFVNIAALISELMKYSLVQYDEEYSQQTKSRPYVLTQTTSYSGEITFETLNRYLQAGFNILRKQTNPDYLVLMAKEKALHDKGFSSQWEFIKKKKISYLSKISGSKTDLKADETNVLNLYIDCIIELLDSINFKGIDDSTISEAFEYLFERISRFENKDSFYTPRKINDLISSLIDIEDNSTVLDFCAGTGSLLATVNKKNKGKHLKYSAQEKDEFVYELLDFNLNKLNKLNAQLYKADSIVAPSFNKADYVISHPPVNLTGYSDSVMDKVDYLEAGIAPYQSSANVSWVQMATSQANKKALLVMDSAFLSHAGRERKLRKYLLDGDLLDTIIYLPENLFYDSQKPSCILIFNKFKEQDFRNRVFLVNAQDEFVRHPSKATLNTLTNIDKITARTKEKRVLENFSLIVTRDEVKNKDYDLNPLHYFHKKPQDIDVSEEQKELSGLEEINDLIQKITSAKTFKFSKKAKLEEVVEFTRGKNYKAVEIAVPADDTIAYFKSTSPEDVKYLPRSIADKNLSIEQGDILINILSTNKDSIGSTLLINDEINENYSMAIFSYVLASLRIKNDMKGLLTPEFLNHVLKSILFRSYIEKFIKSTTTSASNLTKSQLLNFELPVPTDKQERDAILEHLNNINRLKDSLESKLANLDNLFNAVFVS